MCSVFLYPNNNIYSTTTGIFFSEWENRKNFKILAEILTKNSNKLRKKKSINFYHICSNFYYNLETVPVFSSSIRIKKLQLNFFSIRLKLVQNQNYYIV